MFDIVLFMLRFSYYYSRVLGVLNFEINVKTGTPRITRRATIYAAAANLLIFCLLPWISQSELIHLMWQSAGYLHEYIFLTVMGLRITCVVATFYSRWWQRRSIVRLVFTLSRLALRRPEVMRMWRSGVIIKFTSITVNEIIQMLVTILSFRNFLTINLIFGIMLLYMVAALVNVIIAHFYFSMLNLHLHYKLLQQDLHIVLREIQSLENEHRNATFMIKCCDLADRLEDIARRQSELQSLCRSLLHIFGLQGLCISTTTYVSSIGAIYFTFSALQRMQEVKNSVVFFSALVVEIAAYFIDVLITVFNIYRVWDDHVELVQILDEFTSFTHRLDRRLGLVMESFQLQLKREQFKFLLLGIYSMDKPKAVSMFNSVITGAIVLIQHELKTAIEVGYGKV